MGHFKFVKYMIHEHKKVASETTSLKFINQGESTLVFFIH